jgi:hypothetical protein
MKVAVHRLDVLQLGERLFEEILELFLVRRMPYELQAL